MLKYTRIVGRVAAKQNGELANQFPLPAGHSTTEALLTAAWATLEKATAQKEVLIALGMSQKVLDELAAALGEFDKTLEATRAGRRDHPSLRSGQVVGASADLEALGLEIAEQVKLLDGVVQYRFGDDAELMGAWASVRNVVGPSKPKEQTPGEGGSTLREAQGRPPKAA